MVRAEERFRRLGALTPEEDEAVREISELSGQISSLHIVEPIFDGVRVDPIIRKKVAKLKEVIGRVRT